MADTCDKLGAVTTVTERPHRLRSILRVCMDAMLTEVGLVYREGISGAGAAFLAARIRDFPIPY